jgi:protein HIRA/HIR1
VEELLRGLMGGLFADEEDENEGEEERSGVEWGEGDEIVGWKREELLKEVVVVLGKHRDLQRVTVPYAKLLGVLDGADTGSGDVAMSVG